MHKLTNSMYGPWLMWWNHTGVVHLFVVMAMCWYDAFYTLLPYFYILIDRWFHLSFNLYPTPQVLVQKVLTKLQLWLHSVLFLSLLFFSLLLLTIVLLYTSESVMSEYVHCMCKYVCACVYIRMCECVPEGNATIWLQMDVHCTFTSAGPSDCSDNDAAHCISVAAMSLNATGKCNIICSSFLLQHAISTQSNVHNLTCCIYIGIQKLSSVLKAVKDPNYHYAN